MLVTDVIVRSKGTAFSIAHKFHKGEKIAFRQEGDKDVLLGLTQRTITNLVESGTKNSLTLIVFLFRS